MRRCRACSRSAPPISRTCAATPSSRARPKSPAPRAPRPAPRAPRPASLRGVEPSQRRRRAPAAGRNTIHTSNVTFVRQPPVGSWRFGRGSTPAVTRARGAGGAGSSAGRWTARARRRCGRRAPPPPHSALKDRASPSHAVCCQRARLCPVRAGAGADRWRAAGADLAAGAGPGGGGAARGGAHRGGRGRAARPPARARRVPPVRPHRHCTQHCRAAEPPRRALRGRGGACGGQAVGRQRGSDAGGRGGGAGGAGAGGGRGGGAGGGGAAGGGGRGGGNSSKGGSAAGGRGGARWLRGAPGSPPARRGGGGEQEREGGGEGEGGGREGASETARQRDSESR